MASEAAIRTVTRQGRKAAISVIVDPRINPDRPDLAGAIKTVRQWQENPRLLMMKEQIEKAFVPPAALCTSTAKTDFNDMGMAYVNRKSASTTILKAFNRGLRRKTKNVGPGTYQALNVSLPNGNWVLVDPHYYQTAIDLLGQIPEACRHFIEYGPAKKRILEFNLETKSFRCRLSPLGDHTVNYTRLGPKITSLVNAGAPARDAPDPRPPEATDPLAGPTTTTDKKRRYGDTDMAADAAVPAPRHMSRVRQTKAPHPRTVAAADVVPPIPAIAVPTPFLGDAAGAAVIDNSDIAVVQAPPAKKARTAVEERVASVISRAVRTGSASRTKNTGVAKVVSFADNFGGAAQGGAPVKRKRGRPSKADVAARVVAAALMEVRGADGSVIVREAG